MLVAALAGGAAFIMSGDVVAAGDKTRVPVRASECSLPPVAINDRIVLVDAYLADAIPTVTVAGQDEETRTASLHIEEGDSHLYIIVGSYTPMIWRLSGSTNRVSRFVALPRRGPFPGTGVVGLPKKRVTFLPGGRCFGKFYPAGSGRAYRSKAVIEAGLGRPVQKVISRYTLQDIAVPSGENRADSTTQTGGIYYRSKDGKDRFISKDEIIRPLKEKRIALVRRMAEEREASGKPDAQTARRLERELIRLEGRATPTGVDAQTYRKFKQSVPGGVVMIDAGKVLAPGKVEAYEVLPQQAGLIQLMMEERISRRDGFYYIEKPIVRFPPGLHGALSVRFMLARGVPRPGGDSGHSCVLSEEDSEAGGRKDTGRCSGP